MRRLLPVFALLALLCLAPRAEAHVFKYFGSVSVLLHMEPGDDPIASEPAQLFFYFADQAGKFQVTACDCRVKISEGGSVLYDEALTGEAKAYGDEVRLVNFTFPKKDVYKVELSAKEPDYDAFTLAYDVRVDREPAGGVPAQASFPWIWVAGGGGAILAGAVGGIIIKKKP